MSKDLEYAKSLAEDIPSPIMNDGHLEWLMRVAIFLLNQWIKEHDWK